MRNAIAIVVLLVTATSACGKSGEEEGAEAARQQAEEEARKNPPPPPDPPKKTDKLPVAMGIQVPCAQLVDPAKFTAALGEKDPMTVNDLSNTNKDSTSMCSLVRGGKRPSKADMDAALKKGRRLGTIPGDVVCSITAFCSMLENEKHFEEHCKEIKDQDSNDMGTYACVHVVGQGADDQYTYKFLDDDTRCVMEVRGGPSMVDNQVIASCAKAARDLIGPDQIKPAAK